MRTVLNGVLGLATRHAVHDHNPAREIRCIDGNPVKPAAAQACGYPAGGPRAHRWRPWVTSHIYRKTVAALMDEAGLSARAAADQLGHAQVSMTQNRYMKRKVARTGAAKVLGPVGTSE